MSNLLRGTLVVSSLLLSLNTCIANPPLSSSILSMRAGSSATSSPFGNVSDASRKSSFGASSYSLAGVIGNIPKPPMAAKFTLAGVIGNIPKPPMDGRFTLAGVIGNIPKPPMDSRFTLAGQSAQFLSHV